MRAQDQTVEEMVHGLGDDVDLIEGYMELMQSASEEHAGTPDGEQFAQKAQACSDLLTRLS